MNLPEPLPANLHLEPPPASLRLRIDRAALVGNWNALHRLSGKAAAGAAVKADAYGLGIDVVAPILCGADVREYFVAHWSEVPALLNYVEASQISVLHGVGSAQEARFAIVTGVRPVINSLRQAALWVEAGGGRCNVMVDSGINRLGLAPAELCDPIVQGLEIDILLSHLASAEEDSAQNPRQLAIFRDTVPLVKAERLSLANSAGIMLGPDYHFDLTRPGLALYGGIPHPSMQEHIAQVAFPQGAVLQIRHLHAGDAVGYNATWVADRETRVATVSVGHADGFLRQMGVDCALQHDQERLPVLGRVSMDMIMVDASSSTVKEGDFLDLPGDLPGISQRSGLSQYEILTILGKRFERS